MNTKNNSELDKIIPDIDMYDASFFPCRICGSPDPKDLRQAILSTHISKKRVLEIIQAHKTVNQQYHGREDCKSCGLMEALELGLGD